MLLSYHLDPLKFIKSGQTEINEDDKLVLDDGYVIYKSEELRQYSIEEQQGIKKYNIPIELNRAVRYPEIKNNIGFIIYIRIRIILIRMLIYGDGKRSEKPEKLKDLSDMMQKNIRKNKHSIELGKAIEY